MDTAFDDREQLRAAARSFLADASPAAEVRRLMETDQGYDPEVWRALAEGGWLGLHLPERHGGGGAGAVELGVALEEMGAVLLCAPFLSTVAMAANALLASGDEEACAEVLPGIAAGRVVATLAVAEDAGRWDEGGVSLVATPSGGGWRLDGHKSFVLDGHVADVAVVAGRGAAGVSLFLVDGRAPGLTATLLDTVDRTRKQARLELAATPGRLLGAEGGGAAVLERVLHLAAAALAAEQVGGAQRCLDMTVAHARERVQFGRPIGSFQAVQHRCAEMLLEVESARSASQYASWTAAHAPDELPVAAALAKACCSDAYAFVATETIHLHGGVGFTWAHDAHLYFKRAKSSRLLLGDSRLHRELLARRLGW